MLKALIVSQHDPKRSKINGRKDIPNTLEVSIRQHSVGVQKTESDKVSHQALYR